MSKVESFHWNKLSSKSCSFESEQFFDLCFVWLPSGHLLSRKMNDNIMGKVQK